VRIAAIALAATVTAAMVGIGAQARSESSKPLIQTMGQAVAPGPDRGEPNKQANGAPTTMAIEWAKDDSDDDIYIAQARPETIAPDRKPR
jgi:phosphoenolpyruvate synthase/pyruvate phosphate dikinase